MDRDFDPLAFRVAARHVQSDAIGDPQDLLKRYDSAISHISDLDHLLPQMREAQKLIATLGGDDAAKQKVRLNELPAHEAELISNYFRYVLKFWVRVSLDTIKIVNPWSLFLAILQQYDLPPTTRKAIETASKFFAKSRIKAPKREEALDAYENFLKTLRAFSMAAHEAIAHGRPRASGAEGAELTPEKVRAGPFTLINTGGFNDTVIAECARVVEVAAHQLQSHGLGKVCYGDVLISNTLSNPNVLAFYLLQKDEMFVRANLKGKEHAAILTVTHELGHRLMFKFLTGKHREIQHIYNQIANKSSDAKSEALNQVWKDPTLKPKVGDTIMVKGKEYTVIGFDVTHRGEINVNLTLNDSDPELAEARAKLNLHRFHIGLESYAALKGILPKPATHSGFITGYARKDADENFAEMIAYFCADKLPEDQVEMLKAVL